MPLAQYPSLPVRQSGSGDVCEQSLPDGSVICFLQLKKTASGLNSLQRALFLESLFPEPLRMAPRRQKQPADRSPARLRRFAATPQCHPAAMRPVKRFPWLPACWPPQLAAIRLQKPLQLQILLYLRPGQPTAPANGRGNSPELRGSGMLHETLHSYRVRQSPESFRMQSCHSDPGPATRPRYS